MIDVISETFQNHHVILQRNVNFVFRNVLELHVSTTGLHSNLEITHVHNRIMATVLIVQLFLSYSSVGLSVEGGERFIGMAASKTMAKVDVVW